MGVGVQRHAIGAHLQQLLQRAGKGLWRLLWQAVNQVQIDRVKAPRSCRLNQGHHLLHRLNAVNSLLHGRIEILHAKAQPVKSQFGQRVKACRIDGARVHLDREFGAGDEIEAAPEHRHQRSKFIVVQKGRAASA